MICWTHPPRVWGKPTSNKRYTMRGEGGMGCWPPTHFTDATDLATDAVYSWWLLEAYYKSAEASGALLEIP